MNKLKSCSLVFAGFLILVCVFALTNPNTSSGDSLKDVRVINTAAEPVPTTIQGSVGVAGIVQAQQSGAWNVCINGTPTFRIDPANNTIKIDPANNTVKLVGGGTKLALNQSFIGMPTSGMDVPAIDISAFSKIRFSVTVNGSGSIQFYLDSGTGSQFPSGYALDSFSVDSGGGTLTRTYDVAGLSLLIHMVPTDSNNQAIIGVFGN